MLSKKEIKRIFLEAGAKKVSKEAINMIMDILRVFATEIARRSVEVNTRRKKKMIKAIDVNIAYTMYLGFSEFLEKQKVFISEKKSK